MTATAGVTPEQRTFELHDADEGTALGQYIAKATLLKAGQPVARMQRELGLRAAPPSRSGSSLAPATGGAAGGAAGRDLRRSGGRARQRRRRVLSRATSVVAEEQCVQAIVEEIAGNSPTPIDSVLQWRASGARDLSAGVLARRQLRSDLLMVKTSTGWC